MYYFVLYLLDLIVIGGNYFHSSGRHLVSTALHGVSFTGQVIEIDVFYCVSTIDVLVIIHKTIDQK